jgi:hypothetical protein
MRLIKGRDLVDLGALAVLFVLAGIVPERHWGRVSLALARLHVRIVGYSVDHLGTLPAETVGIDARPLEIAFRQTNYWELLEILRDYWPGGWRPTIILVGEEHIKAALARGRGVILWYCTFNRTMIAHYKGLREAGYPVSVLMAGTHGFSDTRFGVRVLNPIRVTIEKRYMGEAFLIGSQGAGPAIRSLIGRLGENRCIHIAAIQTGRHVAERPFLGGRLRLAKGAPSLAVSTGAALLPTFTVPVGPASFEIHIEPPLTSDAADDDLKQEDMVSAYVPVLERYVRNWPELWRGWIGPATWWRPH